VLAVAPAADASSSIEAAWQGHLPWGELRFKDMLLLWLLQLRQLPPKLHKTQRM
jgi:hypothetical protein